MLFFLLTALLASNAAAAPDPVVEMAIRQMLLSLSLSCQHQFSVCGYQYGETYRQQGKYCEAIKASQTCMRTATVYDFGTGVCTSSEYSAIEAVACQTGTSGSTGQDPHATNNLWKHFGQILINVRGDCQSRIFDCLNFTGSELSDLVIPGTTDLSALFELSSPPGNKTELCYLLQDEQPCFMMVSSAEEVCLKNDYQWLLQNTCTPEELYDRTTASTFDLHPF